MPDSKKIVPMSHLFNSGFAITDTFAEKKKENGNRKSLQCF